MDGDKVACSSLFWGKFFFRKSCVQSGRQVEEEIELCSDLLGTTKQQVETWEI